MILCHRTAVENARSISKNGFRDAVGFYGMQRRRRGVWLSREVLDANEGAEGSVILAVECPDAQLQSLRRIDERGEGHEEYLLAARLVNGWGAPRVYDDPTGDRTVEEAVEALWKQGIRDVKTIMFKLVATHESEPAFGARVNDLASRLLSSNRR